MCTSMDMHKLSVQKIPPDQLVQAENIIGKRRVAIIYRKLQVKMYIII